MVQIYAIGIRLQILGPHRNETTDGLRQVSKVFARNDNKRRSFDLLTYAFKLLQERKPTWTIEYICVLRDLIELIEAIDKKKWTQIPGRHCNTGNGDFEGTVCQRNLNPIQYQVTMPWYFNPCPVMETIWTKVLPIWIEFKQVVRRLVRTRLRDDYGSTLLHYAAKLSCFLRVVEVLLECGANANAIKWTQRHSTALVLSTAFRRCPCQGQEEMRPPPNIFKIRCSHRYCQRQRRLRGRSSTSKYSESH